MKKRIKNKILKNSVLVYDRASIPVGMTMIKIIDTFRIRGILIYDSSKGIEPIVIPRRNKRHIKFIDKNDRGFNKDI